MVKDSSNYSGQPVLGQLLSFIPKEIFTEAVKEYQSDKWYKKVKTWDQFVFMFFAILTGSPSLREVSRNFAMMGNKLAHCGIYKIPKRSSISDANAKRKADVFGQLYQELYRHYQQYLSDSYLSMPINGEVDPGKVEIFDSTTVTLFKEIFKGCGRLPKNGRKKGGIKAFAKLTLSERVPNFLCLKFAASNEKLFLSAFELERGTIGVFDKGFQKFTQYEEWSRKGVFYVTRANNNVNFDIITQRELTDSIFFGVQMDADVMLEYVDKSTGEVKKTEARMVAYIDPASKKRLVFLSNMFDVSALTICMLYKNRWVIEPLFKQIKQNFELTYFLSDSQEGIKTQIIIALILNLIFTVIHKMTREVENFSTMRSIAAKNTSSYVAFVAFLQSAEKISEQILSNIRKVQLELFENQQGGGGSAIEINAP